VVAARKRSVGNDQKRRKEAKRDVRFYPGTSYIPALDGIRAVAALLVLSLHVTTGESIPSELRKLTLIGQTGVDLFFVLSGFLITRILLSSRTSGTYFSHFYVRRILRIFPLYYFFLVLFFFVRPLIFADAWTPFSHQIWSWLFLENIPLTFNSIPTGGPNHYWTLAVEEHFYLLWPLSVWVFSTRQLRFFLGGLIILAPIVRIALLSQNLGTYYFTFARMDGLALGSLLAVLYQEQNARSRSLTIVARSLLIALPIFLIPMFLAFSGSHADWLQVVKLSLIPAFYFALLSFCLFDSAGSGVVGIFSLRPLRWLGSISYGLYVYHAITFEFVERFHIGETNLPLRFIVFFGVTVLIAYLSYKFFESPILRLKYRFAY
jgi:peptidoglycan/LPS O-acetylase OafA/YrhL